MKNYLLLLLAMVLITAGCEDDPFPMMEPEPEPIPTPCELGRYTLPEFLEQDVVTDSFGLGEEVLRSKPLFMDIYTPVGDTLTNRPVMILAFGGAFIAGDRSQMEGFARFYTAHGYVVASIDYRIFSGIFPTDDLILDTAVKAMHDVKAAVRYLRNDALGPNRYGIDPEAIIVGGLSAGGVASLQAAFFDEEDLATADDNVKAAIEANGGIEGTSNDLDVSSEVSGVVNFSGGMYSLDWIDAGEPWVLSVHGDADQVVPFETGQVNVGFPLNFTLSGSGVMQDRLDEVGITNALWTVEDGGHVDIYADDAFEQERSDYEAFAVDFLAMQICQ